MSSLSQLTSSSSATPSPITVHPSSSSSNLSFGSSTTDSLSVGVVDVPHPVEMVRGDDPANVIDQSGCP